MTSHVRRKIQILKMTKTFHNLAPLAPSLYSDFAVQSFYPLPLLKNITQTFASRFLHLFLLLSAKSSSVAWKQAWLAPLVQMPAAHCHPIKWKPSPHSLFHFPALSLLHNTYNSLTCYTTSYLFCLLHGSSHLKLSFTRARDISIEECLRTAIQTFM